MADNQRLLIQGVSKLLERGNFLLDGHFTMRRKSDGEIEPINIDVFRELRVVSVVVFTDDPAKISKRMNIRDGVHQPAEMFRLHQEAEVAHATNVADTLGLPIAILHAFDTEKLLQIVNDGFSSEFSDW